MSPLDVPLPFPATKARGIAAGDRVKKRTGGYSYFVGTVEHVTASGACCRVRWPYKSKRGSLAVLENVVELVVVGRAGE